VLPWWGWVLLWAVILVGGGLLLLVRGRRTWRSARALAAEVGRAGALVAALEAETDRLRETAPAPQAVTRDPRVVRAEYRAHRAAARAARRSRREAARPPWADTYTE
jgi:hypothetical protein